MTPPPSYGLQVTYNLLSVLNFTFSLTGMFAGQTPTYVR